MNKNRKISNKIENYGIKSELKRNAVKFVQAFSIFIELVDWQSRKGTESLNRIKFE